MKKVCLIALLILGSSLAGCGSNTESQPSTNTSSAPESTAPAATSSAEPAVVKTETTELDDGSTIVTKTYADGSKTEERSFKSGPLVTAKRQTTAGGESTVRVRHRESGEEVEIEDRSWVEKSMDATGDALATAASKTKGGVETAVDKTKDGTMTAAEKTKEGAQKTGSVVKEGAQKTGSAVKEGAQKVGKGLKKVGGKVKDAVKN